MDKKHLENKFRQINDARKLLVLENGYILKGWEEVYHKLMNQMYEVIDQIRKIDEGWEYNDN